MGVAEPLPHLASICAQAASHWSSLRLETTTLAPCSAKPSAIARPMPLDAPVRSATLPVRSKRSVATATESLADLPSTRSAYHGEQYIRRTVRSANAGFGRRRGMLRPMPPAPAQVPYNDWRRLPVAALAAFVPTEPVSVVIPCYQVPAATLAKTLASLERQRFPRHLLEVVLVDDGIRAAPASPAFAARREGRAPGTVRLRHVAARGTTASTPRRMTSCCSSTADELVEEEWISAHARWHHAAADVLTAGPRWHVATEGLDVEAIRRGNLRRLPGRSADRPALVSGLLCALGRAVGEGRRSVPRGRRRQLRHAQGVLPRGRRQRPVSPLGRRGHRTRVSRRRIRRFDGAGAGSDGLAPRAVG